MHNRPIDLAEEAYDVLKKASEALALNLEATFVYVVRNVIDVYGYVAFGGHLRLIDAQGNTRYLSTKSPAPSPSRFRIRRHTKQAPAQSVIKQIDMSIPGELMDKIELQASMLGRSVINLINSLVFTGGSLAIHLAKPGNQAFAYDSESRGMGKINFT